MCSRDGARWRAQGSAGCGSDATLGWTQEEDADENQQLERLLIRAEDFKHN